MTTFYTVINWLLVFGYWLLVAGVTLRVLMKRRAVPSAMAWLLVIYILPLVGIITYLLFGEMNLGKRRAERAKAMWPSTAQWMQELKTVKSHSRFSGFANIAKGWAVSKATSYNC